jgi:hypothetical protein
MKRAHRVGELVAMACIGLAAAGCNRNQASPPPAQVQSQSTLPANSPTTVTGCLKAGDAPSTYVITTAKTEGGSETATYQLMGGTGTNLADHIGRQVEVSGVIRQTQELASTERAQNAQPRGTAGPQEKPVVETRTEVDIKRLDVSSIKPLRDRCD